MNTDTIGTIAAFVFQAIGIACAMRWAWRSTNEGGVIHRIIVRVSNRIADWWCK